MKGEFKIVEKISKNFDEEKDESPFLGYVEGYASTSDVDREYDVIDKKALSKASGDLKGSKVFLNHEHARHPIGKVVETNYEEGHGVKIRAGIFKATKVAREVWDLIKSGGYDSFSIYGRMGDVSWEKKEVRGKEIDVRVIKDVEFWEVSVVGLPANPNARFSMVAKQLLNELGDIMPEKKEELKTEGDTVDKALGKPAAEVTNDNAVFEKQLQEALDVVKRQSALIEKLLSEKEDKKEKPKEDEEVSKTVVPAERKTTIRGSPTEPSVPVSKMSAKELEMELFKEFAVALADSDITDIWLYGTGDDYHPHDEELFSD